MNKLFLRKKLMYRSRYRGCKETDILLRDFALKYLDKLSSRELIEYEKIIDLDDYELYSYLTSRVAIPPSLSSEVIGLIASFWGLSD